MRKTIVLFVALIALLSATTVLGAYPGYNTRECANNYRNYVDHCQAEYWQCRGAVSSSPTSLYAVQWELSKNEASSYFKCLLEHLEKAVMRKPGYFPLRANDCAQENYDCRGDRAWCLNEAKMNYQNCVRQFTFWAGKY